MAVYGLVDHRVSGRQPAQPTRDEQYDGNPELLFLDCMPTTLDWIEITRRLALTLIAGVLIGLNRWERGRPAGLRTTVLVCLAASVAMIEANLLLETVGRAADSFAQMDVMRLPLGILTGVGFIGAGAIVKRGRILVGITTAATLWFVTVIGLCFGGGQIGIGVSALVLGLIVLWGFRWLEKSLHQERLGTLTLTVGRSSRVEEEVQSYFAGLGFRVVGWAEQRGGRPQERKLRCEVRWTASPKDTGLPAFVSGLAQREDIIGVDWNETMRPDS